MDINKYNDIEEKIAKMETADNAKEAIDIFASFMNGLEEKMSEMPPSDVWDIAEEARKTYYIRVMTYYEKDIKECYETIKIRNLELEDINNRITECDTTLKECDAAFKERDDEIAILKKKLAML